VPDDHCRPIHRARHDLARLHRRRTARPRRVPSRIPRLDPGSHPNWPIYSADDQLLVNQHTYGIPAAQAPVFCLRNTGSGDMAALYLDSFERVWASSISLA